MQKKYTIQPKIATVRLGIFLLLLVTLMDNTVYALSVRTGLLLVAAGGVLTFLRVGEICP